MSAPAEKSQTAVSDAAGKKAAPKPVKSQRTQVQGIQLLPLLLESAKVGGMFLFVWFMGFIGLSVTWVLLAVIAYVVGDELRKNRQAKLTYARQAVLDEKGAILARVDELPSWVYFPDVERAEWLNKMMLQMWPYIGEYVKNILKTSVEAVINKSMPEKLKPFRFENIDLGDIPPRIGGVKVYIDKVTRDEILMDLEITCASDADLTVSVRGLNAGIKDIMLQGTLRVVMKPLITQIPLVGGLTVFFLSQPKIDFDLTNVANILDMPLLSTTLRTIVSDQIASYLVLPNKLPIPLVKDISILTLKYPLPAGVVRLSVVEASELIDADFGLLSSGKSDPYCKIYAAGYSYKTAVIQNTASPVWNETFEMVIDHKQGQFIDLEVMDEDPGEDDKLGITQIDLEHVAASGNIDTWLQLENVKTGRLHIKARWLYLSKNKADIYKAKTCRGKDNHLSTAVLFVTVDSGKDLLAAKRSLAEPSTYVKLEIGNREEKTVVKQKTTNPRWEQTFRFFVVDPDLQDLNLEVYDTNKGLKKIAYCKIPLRQVLTSDDMTLSSPFALKAENECSITLRLVLRILSPEEPKDTPDGSESTKVEESKPEQSKPVETKAEVAKPSGRSSPDSKKLAEKKQETKSRSPNRNRSANREDTAESPVGLKYRGPPTPSDGKYGRIQVTIRYSTTRSQLIVVVHKCVNLIPCDTDNLSDPYVRLLLVPDKSSKKKTQTVKNNLNPVFDETFDWPIAKAEASTKILELSVKNAVGIFSKERVQMGVVQINLSEIDDLSNTVTEWYDLQNPDEVIKDR